MVDMNNPLYHYNCVKCFKPYGFCICKSYKFEYVIRKLKCMKLGLENIAKSPINNAVSEHTKMWAKEKIPELQQAIFILQKAGEGK